MAKGGETCQVVKGRGSAGSMDHSPGLATRAWALFPGSKCQKQWTKTGQDGCCCQVILLKLGAVKFPMTRDRPELPRSRLSGKAMARTGLRMMPTFPLPPLKFRTAGFPRYGFKAGISDAAFPANWFAIVLRALCCHRCSRLCVRDDALMSTSARTVSRSTPGALAPVRVLLSRSILTYPAPSAPLAGTPGLHRLAAYTRCPRCAY